MMDRESENELLNVESILGDTIEKVISMDKRLIDIERLVVGVPEMKLILTSMAASQALMSQAAESMAETFRKAELRAEKQEVRYDLLAQTAAGKDQIPLKSHKMILLSAIAPVMVISFLVVIGALYYTNTKIDASYNALAIGQRQTQEIVQKAETKVTDNIKKDTKEVNLDASTKSN